jgi:FKBP12-rapamycin complex-associated protein
MSKSAIKVIVNNLKSKTDEERAKAAQQLSNYVINEVQGKPMEFIKTFIEEINHQIVKLFRSNSETSAKKGGLLAMITLIDLDVGDRITQCTKFANIIRDLPVANDVSLMELEAFTIGKIAEVSGSLTTKFMDFEVGKAVEWLRTEQIDRHSDKKHCGALRLRELARFAPAFFVPHMSQFFDCIFNAICDQKPIVRECGVDALRSALFVLASRETEENQNPKWYEHCYLEAIKNFEPSPNANLSPKDRARRDDRIHGSLMVLNELFAVCDTSKNHSIDIHHLSSNSQCNKQSTGLPENLSAPVTLGVHESPTCRQLLNEKFNYICDIIMNQRSSKNPYIIDILLILIPRIAAFNSELFVERHLNETVDYLLNGLRSTRDRSKFFIAIGRLASGVKKNLKPYVPRIMDAIRSCLPQRDQRKIRASGSYYVHVEPCVFDCISLMSQALGPLIETEIRSQDFLDRLTASGLSPALASAFLELSIQIPQLRREIHNHLLHMLSIVLMRKPFKNPGLPDSHTAILSSQSAQHISNRYLTNDLEYQQENLHNITLALKILARFDFHSMFTIQFATYCSEHYLNSEIRDIRLESVKTCCQILLPAIIRTQNKHNSALIDSIQDVIHKLLVTAVTDTDEEVRKTVLGSLSPKFDNYLAQVANLNCLFFSLNEEVFEIRELAVCLIGRLSSLNPGFILPSLRKILLNYLNELRYSGMPRSKEQAAKMLGQLFAHAPVLMRAYTEPVINEFLNQLEDSMNAPNATKSVLEAVGLQAMVSGEDIKPHADRLLLLLLKTIEEPSSETERDMALWALGQLIENTGFVIEPYLKYPKLLDILLDLVRKEQAPSVRKKAIRALGLLGAIDPYRHQINIGQTSQPNELLSSVSDDSNGQQLYEISSSELLVSNQYDDFYPAIALSSLIKIMRDKSLSNYYTVAVQAVTFIFMRLGVRCVPYIQHVLPTFINVIRNAESKYCEFFFQQLGNLVSIVKQNIRNYLDVIFELIKESWSAPNPLPTLQITLINLVEQIVVAPEGEFRVYLPRLIPHALKVFQSDKSPKCIVTERLLKALQQFGNNLDDCLYLILPSIVECFSSADKPISVRKTALETVHVLTENLDLTEYAAKIIHPLVRVLDSEPQLVNPAMDTLCAIACQLGSNYKIFVPTVQKVLKKHKISHARYEIVEYKVTRGAQHSYDSEDSLALTKRSHNRKPVSNIVAPMQASDFGANKKFQASDLQRAWGTRKCATREDWLSWLKILELDLLKESPNVALRSCNPLAQSHESLSKELFNAAFLCCWAELNEEQQEDLINSLEAALNAPDVPEVTQALLNLTEFMEHSDKGPLPISPQLLARRAQDCRAFAKALHYKEEEFKALADGAKSTEVLEDLLSINRKLQHPEAAAGVLKYAENNGYELNNRERWYEKLHDWDNALKEYKLKTDQKSDDIDSLKGLLRCYEHVGEWESLYKMATESWPKFSKRDQQEVARAAATAAWSLRRWDGMERFAKCIRENTVESACYRAVLEIHRDNFETAHELIDQARSYVDTDLTAMADEGKNRAYSAMVQVMMLSELEEVIQYKTMENRREFIKEKWWKRLQGCQRIVENWQKILTLRSLVISPHEDMRGWIKFASICQSSNSQCRLKQSNNVLTMLLDCDPKVRKDIPMDHPQVTFAYYKHLWHSGEQVEAFSKLQQFVEKALPRLDYIQMTTGVDDAHQIQQTQLNTLLSRCYLKLGQWQESLEEVNEQSIPSIYEYYVKATEFDRNWYKAWHALAYMSYEAVLFHQVRQYTIPAIKSFFRSIALSNGNSFQDTLSLLTLWFDYAKESEVNEAFADGMKTVPVETWLQVIPQLIARIDTPSVNHLLQELLTDIGKYHPQALIYPLTVASKSTVPIRQSTAAKMMNSMKEHSSTLVAQALLVSDELIRIAILWHELWHEGLEEASRLYFGEKNVQGMLNILEPLHQMVARGAQSLKEMSFQQAYGRDLQAAHDWCNEFKKSGNTKDLTQAWDLYYLVFKRIAKQLPLLTSLELNYVSPKLEVCHDLELAVPGSYVPHKPVIKIQRVKSNLQVITSKQRPRKLCIKGSDGKDYMFLLKGHEDLRQDERVMQLFGLVNTLLVNEPETSGKNLTIQRYAVIPLSTNSGLIGWVPHCDTLHTLIKDYRERRKVVLNIEHRLMLRMTPDYEHLTLMQKVEVFEHALSITQGDDLARLLWLKSPNSEVWFERRTNYTRSLATMSMVGYVLGLGDRHPSNLMLDRLSGKILHIDFGDCFEVAMTRDKYPEKIPFRLTRMLINAMEVTGIEGTYRMTCEKMMQVLRKNKDSLMAVLEAFIYIGTSEPDCNQSESKALDVVDRVRNKLTGKDFDANITYDVANQVDLLIKQATANENLCQCYIGWCPFW